MIRNIIIFFHLKKFKNYLKLILKFDFILQKTKNIVKRHNFDTDSTKTQFTHS